MNQKPSIALQALVAVWWVFPYMIPNYTYMNNIEFTAMMLTCVFQGCGVYVFSNKKPDLWPSTFGFHEVFHTLVVSAGVCVLICNYSIISRHGVDFALESINSVPASVIVGA
jgi:predicted membrane channel-forming protein YqfA (hemolysin III family)